MRVSFLGRLLGLHPIPSPGLSAGDKVLLSISLGERFQGAYYKLIAALIVIQ